MRLLLILLCAAVATPACADPLIGYLLSADDSSIGIGGRLSVSAPPLVRAYYRLQLPASVIELGGGYADYYRTSGLENPGSSFASGVNGSAWTSRQRAFPWVVGVAGENRRVRLSYNTDQAAQDYRTGRNAWTTTFISGMEYRRVAALGSSGFTSDDRIEPAVALGYHNPRLGSLFLHWQRYYPLLDTDLGWRGNVASFEIGGMRDRAGLLAQFKPLRGFHTDLKISRDQLIREQDSSLSTTLEPWGKQWSYHGLITYDPSHWSFSVGGRGMTLSAQAYGDKGELQYAKITRAEVDIASVFATISRSDPVRDRERLLEFEYVTWSADARGHTEFWPFTSGFVDLLGLRRYFIASAAGDIARWHLGVCEPVRGNVAIEGGLNFADLHMRADFEHWRPEYLYFGKTDVQYQRFDLYRAWIGGLSGGARWNVKRFELGYAFTQLLPVKTWSTTEPSDDASQPTMPTNRPYEYGGAVHRLSLKYRL